MIEHILSENYLTKSNDKESLYEFNHTFAEIMTEMKALYKRGSFKERSLFKVRLYHQSQKQLVPVQLSTQVKWYIITCFWMINRQFLSMEELNTILAERPTSENQISDIQVQDFKLKIRKHSLSLQYNLISGQISLEPTQYFFNSYDKSGEHDLLSYSKSFKTITVKAINYQFDGKIRFIQSSESYAAVVTSNSVYIISLKINTGQSSVFPIENCKDAKWSSKGLYCLQQNGYIALLEPQKSFFNQPRKSGFKLSQLIQTSNLHNSYICKRIVVQEDNLIGIFFNATEQSKIIIHILNSSSEGRMKKPFEYQLENYSGRIIYHNALVCQGFLMLLVCTGQGQTIEEIHKYIFGVS